VDKIAWRCKRATERANSDRFRSSVKANAIKRSPATLIDLVSLDMQPSEYDAAPTWHDPVTTVLPADTTVRVALSRS
jgi:hypothetical protein